jgi:hypothetical protein
MSTFNHLKRAVQILRDNHEQEINESSDWYWNLKHWTINFIVDTHYQSVTAYRVQDNLTDWSDYITLEAREAIWKELV